MPDQPLLSMLDERMFPIQAEMDKDNRVRRPAGCVPWGIAEAAYATYSKWYGKDQSLERLAERGGFGWSELVSLLRADSDFQQTPGSRTTGPDYKR